jgi:hypothetical protein
MRSILTGLAWALAAATGAGAQVIDDPQANVVEALVVSAKLPGPAWWRVSDGDTTIYVLGAPSALPKGMSWDTSVLDHRLDGAFAVLTPPVARAGLTDIPALLQMRSGLKGDGAWAQSSPELAARLQRVWNTVEPKHPDGWKAWKPLFVAMTLGGKVDNKDDLSMSEPNQTLYKLARKHKVKPRPAQAYKAMPMLKTVVREHSEQAGLACLSETLADIETGPEPRRTAAHAWAEGRVKAALTAPRSAERGQYLLPGVPEMVRQSVDGEADALADLLKTPGHAVAVYPIRGLVAEGGVLDKLRARGITVRTPGDG